MAERMTRHDVANLIIRTFALWLGVTGMMTLASVPWLTSLPDQPAPIFTALILTTPLPAGVALWKMSPRLACAVFDRPDDVVSYAIAPDGVPPLASFVVVDAGYRRHRRQVVVAGRGARARRR
jgi:hypothetical protein